MEKTIVILEELKAITPVLASLRQPNVYTVPEGYFEHLATDITARINVKMLLTKSNVFEMPEGYFENLSDKILSKISAAKNEFVDELKNIAPLLNSISKKNIYSVPQNYFETFSVNKKQAAKIISFSIASKWVSYAAAAIIAGVLITGGFLYEKKTNSFDVAKALNNFSDEELHSYAENNAVMFTVEGNVLDQNVPDIKQELKIISDDELQQYLNDNTETYLETSPKTN